MNEKTMFLKNKHILALRNCMVNDSPVNVLCLQNNLILDLVF